MTVREALEAQLEAWNRGDLDAFCGWCADDVVYVHASGTSTGRDRVRASYASRYPDPSAMGTLSLSVDSLEERGDLAVVVGRWALAGGPSGRTMLVFRRTDAGWRLAYDATFTG
jgi:ketosteroid isomerase-like protein